MREPEVFTLAYWCRWEPEMFLAKRAECYLSGLTLSSCHPFCMQQSQKQITGGPYSLPIKSQQAMVVLATSILLSCVGRARAVKGYFSNAEMSRTYQNTLNLADGCCRTPDH